MTVVGLTVMALLILPSMASVAVDSGKMALTVARERMRPGESIEIRTPNAVAAVRGTALVVEVIRATTQAGGGTAGSTTVFYGFTGSTTITFSDGTTGTLGPNQFFSQTGNGPVSSGTMTASQRSDALSGLQPTNQPLTSGNDGGAKDTAVAQTAALTAAVGGNVLSAVKLNAQPPLYNNLINPCSSVSGSQACGPAAQTPPAPSPPPPSLPVAKPATGILIFGDNLDGDPSARAALASDLRSLGHGVITNVDRLPGDISAYGTIWQVSAFAPLTAAEQTELAGHLARGGGLHLTGEHPCCDAQNDSLTSFLRSAVVKGLVIGSDRPLQPPGSAPVFDMDNGATAVVNGRAYKVDTALLEATAPLLNLKNGSALTTLASAIDLTNRAKLTMANDAAALVSLNQSLLTVASGHLVNVASGSRLNVAGDLVSLAGGSQLSILNGLLLNVTGGSVASVGGSLVRFTGSGNLVSVTNSLAPSAIIGDIPVYGNPGSFKITGNPLAGLGTAGTIVINGVTLTPATAVSKLTGSLVAIQGSGSVRIGP